MIIITPPKRFPRKRRKPCPAPGAPGLTITQAITDESVLNLQFSGPITWDGVTVPSNFRAFTTDGDWQSCINVTEVGAAYIKVEFNAGVDAGAEWLLDGPMLGIAPDVAWPQSGVAVP